MPRLILLCIATLCLALLSIGCAGPPVAQVDSMGEAHREEIYLIQPGQTEVRPNDLYFAEYKKHLADLLQNLGYQLTEDNRQATAVVWLSYEAKQDIVGGGASGTRVGVGIGTGGYHGGWSLFGLGIGSPLNDDSPSMYWRYVIVLDAVTFSAIDAVAEQSTLKSLWKISIVSSGRDSNLRTIFPEMLKAAAEYIGRDSGGLVTVNISPN